VSVTARLPENTDVRPRSAWHEEGDGTAIDHEGATMSATERLPVHDEVHVDVTEHEFERRLATRGHSPSEIHELWRALVEEEATAASAEGALGFGSAIAMALGMVLVIAAIASLLGIYWETLDPWGVIALGILSACAFLAAGELMRGRGYELPAQVLQTVAVGFVPLVAYGVVEAAGFWPENLDDQDHIFGGATVVAVATVAVAVVLLALRPTPFLLVPIAAGTAFLAADLSEVVLGNDASAREHWAFVLPVGVLWVAGGLWLDVAGNRAFATWAHWSGLAIAGVSLMMLVPKTVPGFAVIGVLGAIAMFFSAFVRHWSFTVIGALGVLVAVTGAMDRLGGAAPLALVVLGIALIVVGLRWSRWRDQLRTAVLARLPSRAQALLARLAP
jgi:hypothetical protein